MSEPREEKKILQIMPAPQNMYIQYHDDERPDCCGFARAVCLALVEYKFVNASGVVTGTTRYVEAMEINPNMGNCIDAAEGDNVRGLLILDTPPAPLWDGLGDDAE